MFQTSMDSYTPDSLFRNFHFRASQTFFQPISRITTSLVIHTLISSHGFSLREQVSHVGGVTRAA